MTITPQVRCLVVLVASDCDVTTRALVSVLETQGYAVDHVRSGREVVDAVRDGWPSAVIVDAEMPDMTGVDVCRALRGEPQGAGAVPIIVVNGTGARRSDRLAAFGAGAWEVCPRPLDGTLLLLRLQTFLQARQMNERLRTGSLLDPETGIYNLSGLLLRAGELQSLAARRHESLACIAFTPEARMHRLPAPGITAPSAAEIARICRSRLRASDVLGRIGPSDFAILAPETDGDGALRLLHRLQASLDDVTPAWGGGACPLRVTCGVIADCAESVSGAGEYLLKAVRALRESFRGLPPATGGDGPPMLVTGTSIGMPLLR